VREELQPDLQPKQSAWFCGFDSNALKNWGLLGMDGEAKTVERQSEPPILSGEALGNPVFGCALRAGAETGKVPAILMVL
jgi:hypothetical protein